MKPSETAALHRLYARCHPGWRALPPLWFFAHPTLVIRERGLVIASTSCALAPAPVRDRENDDEVILWGRDVCVDPDYRGRGLGLALCEARFALGRDLGVEFFVGMTWFSNTPMIRIFERQGCQLSPARIQNAYPDNPPGDRVGFMYTRGI